MEAGHMEVLYCIILHSCFSSRRSVVLINDQLIAADTADTGATAQTGRPSVKITIPDNTSLVLVNGTRSPYHGDLVTRFSPSPPGWGADEFRTNLALSRFQSSAALDYYEVYYQPLAYFILDPAVQYSLNLSPDYGDSRQLGLGLYSLTYYSALWWVAAVTCCL